MGGIVKAVANFVTGGSLAQRDAQREARRQQKRAQEEQRAATAANMSMEQAKDDEARRQQIRETRKKRAMVAQAAENNGTGYASGDIGGQGALGTEYYGNQQYLNTQTLGREANAAHTQQSFVYQQKAQNAITKGNNQAAWWGALNNLTFGGLGLYASFNGNGNYQQQNQNDNGGGGSGISPARYGSENNARGRSYG